MKKIRLILTIMLFITGMTTAQNSTNYARNQLIIKFKENTRYNKKTAISHKQFENKDLDILNTKYSVKEIQRTGNPKQENTYILKFKTDKNIPDLVEKYKSTGFFDFVEPNYIGYGAGHKSSSETIPSDKYFSRQWGLRNDGSFAFTNATAGADIEMEKAWDITQGDSSIIIAVLDAGAKLDHPEFTGRIWKKTEKDPIDGKDNDTNGYIDDYQGWDFVNIDNQPSDDMGHGTNVAGIIGANGNNNSGYAGIDWNCKLMICKVINKDNFGYYSWWADAVYYAVNNGAKVINMSLGGDGYSSLLESAIDYAYNHGVTVVVAMMNTNNNTIYYPAAFPTTIAVGSTDPDDTRSAPFFWSSSSGSNYGNHIDVVAPGNYIFGLDYLSNTNFDSYWGGTSQATPLVSGLSALLLAQDTSRTPDEIRELIRNSAEDKVGNPAEDTPGFDIYYGYGRINANNALRNISSTENLEKKSFFSIYPNPSHDYFYLSSTQRMILIRIINGNGKIVLQKKLKRSSIKQKINILNLPKGIYILQAFGAKKNLFSTKFIKN